MRRVLLLSLLSGAVGFGQPPRDFFPWWDRPVVQNLNLSQPQIRQIRLTVRDYRTRLVDARTALDKAEQELQDAFNAEPFDQRRAEVAVDGLSHARETLTRLFAEMSLKLRVLLDANQWRELQRRRLDAEEAERRKKLRADPVNSKPKQPPQ